jgi:hypothetical protein
MKNNVYSNENLKENLKLLENMGYKYIVKAKDKFLSGWGKSGPAGHIQLIAAKDIKEVELIMDDLKKDKTFNYIDYQFISNYKAINNYTRGKSFTIRNDWTKHLKSL